MGGNVLFEVCLYCFKVFSGYILLKTTEQCPFVNRFFPADRKVA